MKREPGRKADSRPFRSRPDPPFPIWIAEGLAIHANR
jgi:hypothetical protein